MRRALLRRCWSLPRAVVPPSARLAGGAASPLRHHRYGPAAPQRRWLASAARPKAKAAAKPKGRTRQSMAERMYQKKTPREHVLLRPDTYVGSTQSTVIPQWVEPPRRPGRAPSKLHMELRDIAVVPALYKIYDEILVNAADNRQRDPAMTSIRVTIDEAEGVISVWNDGAGIPVVEHRGEGVWIPELVLGHLLTGSNFDDTISKVTGGRNGYGAKLANIFSTSFVVETLDCVQRLHYRQEWQDNMQVVGKAVITPLTAEEAATAKDYTCITFKPDLAKFGMKSLGDNDVVALMRKRAYDVAACNEGLNVELNGTPLRMTFEDYFEMHGFNREQSVFARIHPRWEVGVGVNDTGTLQHVSFVNSINTAKGGTHVDMIVDAVTKALLERIRKRSKDVDIAPAIVRNHLVVFVNALVDNPAFDSQTKEVLATKPADFGSVPTIPDRFIRDIMERTTIVDTVTAWAKARALTRMTSGRGGSQARLLGIPKLEDANMAGSKTESSKCTLILTEGDSAKALAVSGLSVVGRDYFGVFPLKGKVLNVRDASIKSVADNAEISTLQTILGLSHKLTYATPAERDKLRYGRVMLMTDQDHDGSHIKGLVLNFFHTFWPSLMQCDEFLVEFITPIVKAFKGKASKPFFTLPEYEKWLSSLSPAERRQWRIKYYKGLGTNTAAEAKTYFSDLDRHVIPFQWDSGTDAAMHMAFSKDASHLRKEWLQDGVGDVHVDHSKGILSYSDFVHQELKLFSFADVRRSIPSVVDGLKPGQRKVLWACFKRNLTQEIKVAQLAGYVSEHAAYHHGEAALHGTVVNMAQNFVGSNNVPLLHAGGQFGTRLQGGKDAASARYIFTKLAPIARKIFHPDDDAILSYVDEDGTQAEPVFYVPIIPMILVNGCEGVGTGWRTSVPSYNPLHVADNVALALQGKALKPMEPYYHGHDGAVVAMSSNQFSTTGRIEVTNKAADKLTISELPVGKWTTDYKVFLSTLLKGNSADRRRVRPPQIRDFSEHHTDNSVLFKIDLVRPLDESQMSQEFLLNFFKLVKPHNTKNMNLWDANGAIKEYVDVRDIVTDFIPVRLQAYADRKAHLIAKLEVLVKELSNKNRFCAAVISGELPVLRVPKPKVVETLSSMGFDTREGYDDTDPGRFDYLLNMSLHDLTAERVQRLTESRDSAKRELDALAAATPESLWLEDLKVLKADLRKLLKTK